MFVYTRHYSKCEIDIFQTIGGSIHLLYTEEEGGGFCLIKTPILWFFYYLHENIGAYVFPEPELYYYSTGI